ncbi:MAG: DNA polymerase III subunit alpha [Lachnospiraceae bacterium]|nr:DNA polymerase III subunit alpha [Lachnospiraceae bacterium]
MAFTHLHVHTEWSLLDGSNKTREYVKRAKELGFTSVSITDHGVMYGVIDFYKACQEEGLNPIIGCEVYVAPNSRFDRETEAGKERYYHLILLAENNTGYQNLSKIVSHSFTEGYYYKPRVDYELLEQYHEGIIASSACLAGELARDILKDDLVAAEEAARRYDKIFGHGNFFLEMQDHGYREQQQVNPVLMQLSEKLDIPLIVTNDVHYTYAEDPEAHDILLCIQTGKKLSDEDRMRYPGGQFYLKSEEEMRSLFPYAQEAIENTNKIAERCHVEIEFGHTRLPHFDVPEGYDSWTYLNKLCEDGLKERYPDADDEIYQRLDYELHTIKDMGYVDYFLIVWDYINYARMNGIPVGPGRGSAAGSIVSYCLKITDIDPLRYSLLFERFLNPERISMPDIDVDFGFERRQEVIDYVTNKYGRDRVMQIITFGTLQAKGVVRDVGRVMDLPYGFVDGIAKMIPNELGITLEKALVENRELKKAYEEDDRIRKLIDMSRRLEGLPRHSSVHAAGVVICSEPAEDLVPLSRAQDGSITTQFTMTTIEELGLLKMDFLGLRTLTVIQSALEMAGADLSEIDYEDAAVYDMIGRGECDGIFQLESAGMTSFMKELKPRSLEDLTAGISLYRPGPMDFIPKYIQGKNNADAVTYACDELIPILKPTYGCIVYQEQVMQIVRDLGGYTLGRSDLVRRAMSKKKQSVMEKERQNFVYGNKEEGVPGCVAKGIPADVAAGIYDDMMDFAKYAFNKSHAACYAVVGFQTAWLKYHYPTQFMAALLTSVIDAPEKCAGYILTCRSMGIRILPPNINASGSGFSVEGDAVRYGLRAIRGVGVNVIASIEEERKRSGDFKDLTDFIDRMTSSDKEREINKRVVESFIKSGTFDTFPATRKQMMVVYTRLLEDRQSAKKNDFAGQMTLFDIMDDKEKEAFAFRYPDVGEYDKQMLLTLEKEVLGFYISGHPLEEVEVLWKKHSTRHAADFYLDGETGQTAVRDKETCVVGGIIADKTIKYTKNNQVMAFITLEDLTGSVECIVFPKTYETCSALLVEDNRVFVKGRVQAEDDKDGKLIAESMTAFEDVPGKLWIRFADKDACLSAEEGLLQTIAEHRGNDEVILYLEQEKSKKVLPKTQCVKADEELIRLLRDTYGEKNVEYRP